MSDNEPVSDDDITTEPPTPEEDPATLGSDADGTDADGTDADGSDGDSTDVTDGDSGDADGTDADAPTRTA